MVTIRQNSTIIFNWNRSW